MNEWGKLQEELVQLSTNSIQVLAHESHHGLEAQPELVVETIRMVIKAVNENLDLDHIPTAVEPAQD